MLRLAVLIFVTALIWFTLNDSPGVTRATPSPATPVVAVPVKPIVAAPEKTVVAQAQTERSTQTRKPRAPSRITVYPASNMVRHCVDWYAEERRPSGTVVVPHMRCRWVRR